MTDVKTDKEPSIEEILESIRQIISEDDAPAATPTTSPHPTTATTAPQSATLNADAQNVSEASSLDVLELTDRVDPPSSATDSFDKTPEVESTFTPPPPPQMPMSPPLTNTVEPMTDPLVSDSAAYQSATAMAKLLHSNVAVENYVADRVGAVTLEDMARDLMRPLIKTWLDQNLPRIIEKMVQKEIERISRKAESQG